MRWHKRLGGALLWAAIGAGVGALWPVVLGGWLLAEGEAGGSLREDWAVAGAFSASVASLVAGYSAAGLSGALLAGACLGGALGAACGLARQERRPA